MPVVKSRIEAAELLDVTEKTIGNWKHEPGFPFRDDDQYDTDAIQSWRAARQSDREREASQDNEELRKTRSAKRRGIELGNEERELRLQTKRGELLPRELVTELIRILMSRTRDAIHNLQKAGNVTGAKMISEQLEQAKKQIDDRLARTGTDPAT